jgi:hypothetical protein
MALIANRDEESSEDDDNNDEDEQDDDEVDEELLRYIMSSDRSYQAMFGESDFAQSTWEYDDLRKWEYSDTEFTHNDWGYREMDFVSGPRNSEIDYGWRIHNYLANLRLLGHTTNQEAETRVFRIQNGNLLEAGLPLTNNQNYLVSGLFIIHCSDSFVCLFFYY